MAKRSAFVEARRGKRRKQIFKGAVKVFAEKGFHAATTREIADAAGLAKGTLYEYVEDKEEILYLVIQEAMEMVKHEIETSIAGIDDPGERLRRAISVQLEFSRKYKDSARVIMYEMSSLSTEGKKKHSELAEDLIEILAAIIDDGIQKGRFKEMDSRLAAELFLYMATFYFNYGDFPHQKYTLDEITEFIMDNSIEAIMKQENRPLSEPD
ncbi:MAG TPA: TetR/AcrR family transcriptional regulator [bacterium]|nr:TetR/AcrR family transcriptional regulator [bacterium]